MKKLFFAVAIFFNVAANAQLQIPHSVKVISNESADWKYGPWASTTSAKTNVPSGLRVGGLTVYITSCSCEYWWLDTDLTDSGLIVKSSAGGWGLTGTTTLTGDVVIDASTNTLKFIQDIGGIGTFNESLTLGLVGGITPGVHLKHSSHSTTYTSSIDMDDTNGLLLKATGGGGPITIDGSASSSGAVNIIGTSNLTGQVNLATKPTRNDAAYQLLARDSTTGEIQFVKKSSISGGGAGTVNSGTANNIAYYSSTGTAVSGTNALPNGTTATTQSPGDNTTKVATNAFVLANAGTEAYPVQGNIINESWANLTSWTKVGGNTFTVAGGKVTLVGGTPLAPNFGSYYYNNAWGTSNLEEFEITTPVTVGTVNSTSWGVAFSLYGQTANAPASISAALLLDNSGGGQIAFYFNNSSTGVVASTGKISVTAADVITLKLKVIKGHFLLTATNTTTLPGQSVSLQYDYSFVNTTSFVTPSVFYYAIQALGGSHSMGNLIVKSNVPQSPSLVYVGDSNVKGYKGMLLKSNTATETLSRNYIGLITDIAGPNCKIEEMNTAEILALTPVKIVVSLGINNLALGDSDATIRTKLATLMGVLTGAGYVLGTNLFITTLRPYQGADVTGVNTDIRSDYAGGFIELFYPFWSGTTYLPNTTYFANDQLHLNPTGAALEAGILASYLGLQTKRFTNFTAQKSVVYNDINGYIGVSPSNANTQNQPGYLLELADPSTRSMISLQSAYGLDNGAYMTSATANDFTLTVGNEYTGNSFKAKATTPTVLNVDAGVWGFYSNSGATPGSNFTPTLRFQISTSGLQVPSLTNGIVTGDGSGNLSTTASPTITGLTTTHHLGGSGTVSVSLGAGAGSGSPSFSAPTGTTDLAGRLDVGTGTSPTGSNATILTLTFASAYTHAPFVILTPASNDASALTGVNSVYVETTTTTFLIKSGATGLNAGGDYKWYYHVIE